ncbi:MAG: hypothetical protein AMJ92_02785 [candidate division Zixibacteria bacterium SM23_81]|nr:MAG: hypothetical protein AMJ92_02785 [candidate division Zixibacteria bacterium SM23_81]
MSSLAKESFGKKGGVFQASRIWLMLAVCLPLVVYFFTLCPTIFVGDSGELVTGAYCLGIVHPPGYPLYCLVGRLMALLPLGNVAQRLNLLSALSAAVSAGLVFQLTIRLGRRMGLLAKGEGVEPKASWLFGPGLLASLLCGFARTLWSQAVVAEVYALNLFLLLFCLLLLIWWDERGERRHLFLFAFILGLSLAHHSTAALAIPAFLLFLLWHRRKLFENARDLPIAVTFLILGGSIYLYLPLRASANPLLEWGHPVSIRGTWAHITRISYGSLSQGPFSWRLLGDEIGAFWHLLNQQFGPFLWGLGLVGLVALFRRAKDWLATSLGLFLMFVVGVALLLRFPVTSRDIYLVQVFFIPAFVIVALWIGIGSGWLMSRVLVLAIALGSHLRRPLGAAMGYLIPLLAIVPLWGNFTANDRSQETLAVELGRNILDTMEPGALLFTSRDTPTFSLAFARIVEGLRPEVSLQHTGQADIFRHLNPSAKPLSSSTRAIYGTIPADLPKIPGLAPYQVGIVYQLRKAPAETDERLRIWDRYNLRGVAESRHRQDFFLCELIRNYATARGNLAQELAQEGRFQLALREAGGALAMDSTFFGAHLALGNIYFQKGDYDQATRAYGHALNWAPENVEVMNNLALTSLRMGDVNGAIQLYRHSVVVEPLVAKTHNDLGLAYKAAGLYDQAAVEYRRAMELDPDYGDPLRNLGVVYAYHLVDYSKAISLWEKYLYLKPQDEDQGMIADEIRRMKILLEDK